MKKFTSFRKKYFLVSRTRCLVFQSGMGEMDQFAEAMNLAWVERA